MRRFASVFPTFFVIVAATVAQLKPPVAPVHPVTDTYFGTVVVDPYRWMEASGPELLDYMKAENAVTEQALKPLASQDSAFLAELTKLADTVAVVSSVR